VETAVNALWDAAPLVGDRITVMGAGMVGCCIAALAARIPGADVQVVDVLADRAQVVRRLGARFARPEEAETGRDVVFHASATAAGLNRSLELLAREGTVIELSWYGDREVTLGLGGAFHSGRLSIRSSQVGLVAPARRSSRSYADRLALALDLLRDPAYDALLTSESTFDGLPEVLGGLARGENPGLCHVVTYSGE
jgi:threonine dehydrogenase-like Zn-dependent dehydrogenase